jgi:NADPH-dependent 2,4-dienoyl-CoA reductase/sulfur reductase-like enzyme
MAAARAASNTGAGVLLVDLADRLGGALVAMGIDAEATSELASAIQHNPRVQLALQTALIGVRGDLVQLHGPAGMWEVRADTLVVATGGREPTRGSLLIPGTRPAGVLTAGAALRLLTATGRLPGANVVLAGQGVWAAQVTERLAAAGASVTQVHDSIADIQGWPRISEVRLNSGQQIACDLLVLAEPPVPWETTDLTGASIQILFAGAIALGACDDTRAAAHGAEVGVWAATGVPLG